MLYPESAYLLWGIVTKKFMVAHLAALERLARDGHLRYARSRTIGELARESVAEGPD